MLCSVPPGKSTSNWLERLRTTRGFPTSSGIDLDHFLTSPPNQDSSVPSPAPDPSTSEPAPPSRCLTTSQSSAGDGNSDKEWYGIMNNVLSELFIMGDQRPCPSKKSSRKQRNPRFCPNFAKKDETAIIATVSVNSHSKSPEKTANGYNVGLADEEEEVEEEEEEEELVGYSRSEVTVIDTSCAEWKFEKLLFRRKSVWKARDRKGKSRGGPGKKKKKRNLAADEDAIVHGKKKHKISNSELVSLKEGLGNPNGSTLVYKNKKMVHNPTQGSNIRFLGSVPPKNTEKKKLKL